MKFKLLTALALAFTFSAYAQDKGNPTAMDPKKAEMMKAWEAYATPGPNHKILTDTAGKWKYTSKMWETPAGKPEESTGTSEIKATLGGRFIEQIVTGKMMGQKFEGKAITGYDNLKNKYETLWIDNMGTGMMKGSGTFDAATKTLKDSGSYSCPMTPGNTRDYRSEWKIIDKNSMSFTMYGPDESGKEFKQMEMNYTRVR